MIQAALRALPLFLPMTVLGIILSAWISRRSAPRLRIPPFTLWLFITSLTTYAALTVTPVGPLADLGQSRGSGASSGGGLGLREVRWSQLIPPLHALLTPSDASLNAAAGVGLGFAAALVTLQVRRFWPIGCAVAAPLAAEGIQAAFPILGRSGTLFGDVTVTWFGIMVGFACTTLVVRAMAARRGPQKSYAGHSMTDKMAR